MDAKLNFLFAVLAGVIMISLAMSLRSCGSTPATPEFFEAKLPLDTAIERARTDDSFVLALFTADWCPVCARFKKGPLASSAVRDWVESYAVPAYVDVTKARSGDVEQQVLLTRYRVDSLPTVLILRNGQEAGRVSGHVPRRDLLKWLRSFSDQPAPE
jgi:thiol:disulfide interchange protein